LPGHQPFKPRRFTATHFLPEKPGSYVLLFRPAVGLPIRPGRLGAFHLRPGLYAYVGSALGSGGLRARVAHHLREKPATRWHVDALTQQCAVEAVCWVAEPLRIECDWVQLLLGFPGANCPITGFGSSDCRRGCRAHLVQLPSHVGPPEVAQTLWSVATGDCSISWLDVLGNDLDQRR
jgi:Uri superfamily endonuclease